MTVSRVILVGLMGSGKSTVGALLAAAMGWRFVDTDDSVAAAAGMSVAEIFLAEGEAAFRRMERAAVARAAGENNVVVASGGGAVLDADNRAAMRRDGSAVVWLTAATEVLAARVGKAPARPLLSGGDVRARLAALISERESLYQEVASCRIVQQEGDTPQNTVDQILNHLNQKNKPQ